MSNVTRLLSLVMVALGLTLIVKTLNRGGGPLAIGLLVGALFVCAGVGRMWLEGRR